MEENNCPRENIQDNEVQLVIFQKVKSHLRSLFQFGVSITSMLEPRYF